MTDAEGKGLQDEAACIRRAFAGYFGDLSGNPEAQLDRQALLRRYEELGGRLPDGPGAQTLPGLCGGEADASILSEREGEEMLMRMEAWNIRLCLRKLRGRGGDVSESREKLQGRYKELNLELGGDRFREVDFCSAPELASE